MDISSFSGSPASIAQLSTAMSNANLGNAVSVSVLKKSLDVQEQSALQLVQAIPDVSGTAPGGPGGIIDIKA